MARLERAWKLYATLPPPIPCPMHLFQLAALELYILSNKPANAGKEFSRVLGAVLASDGT